jgi:hypothetical protein
VTPYPKLTTHAKRLFPPGISINRTLKPVNRRNHPLLNLKSLDEPHFPPRGRQNQRNILVVYANTHFTPPKSGRSSP